jgi:hypothetical protein
MMLDSFTAGRINLRSSLVFFKLSEIYLLKGLKLVSRFLGPWDLFP